MKTLNDKRTLVLNAVLYSLLYSGFKIAVIWWLLAWFFISDSGLLGNLITWVFYMVLAILSTSSIYSKKLTEQLHRCGLSLSGKKAFIIAVISPIFLFASMGIITIPELSFADDRFDGIVAISGFALSALTVMFLTNRFSKTAISQTKRKSK